MGKVTGFLEFRRQDRPYRKVAERIKNFHEFVLPLPEPDLRMQAARCMDCGIPFCHQGCPVNNMIPDWNDLVYRGDWRAASATLHSTNNFPEFTGRVCPAPCEAACTLSINDAPVTIKTVECQIVDKAWAEGWLAPEPAATKTGKQVAVVGSGPAGLAAAQQLARAGHTVTLFEKADRIGGLLRYGIPDFKLEKALIDRRMKQMAAEGVEFRTSCHVGRDMPAAQLMRDYDAVVLTGGAEAPRDLPIPGRKLKGIHFAMDYLTQQNRRDAGDTVPSAEEISAAGRHVVVIGGGDTGSDCIGTANRQGAASVTQLEILPRPPEHPDIALTWPDWPLMLRTSHAHLEGCERDWSITTKEFRGNNEGHVSHLRCARVRWETGENGRPKMTEDPDSAFDLKADLVLLAMGFVHPVHQGMVSELKLDLDPRGNVAANTQKYQTSVPKVFTAGDMRRGQSLVVWAIREGRQAARAVDEFLMGRSDLPR